LLLRVTVPPADGLTFTVSEYVFWVKVAVTALLPFMVIVTGLAVPEASPLHPENDHPVDGVAVSWTLEP
jgi:hypothetical protein